MISTNSNAMQQQEQAVFCHGQAVFKKIYQKQLSEEEEIKKILLLDSWPIGQKKYTKFSWKNTFKHMISTTTNEVFFSGNFHPNIIKEIQNVHYTNLKRITLSGNRIENIQSLVLIDFKNLESLSLRRNNINRLKCLEKLSLKNLIYIDLNQNRIIDLSYLTKLGINSMKFNQLQIQMNSNFENRFTYIHQDLSFIFKLESQEIQLLIMVEKRRKQLKILELIKQRFKTTKIFDMH